MELGAGLRACLTDTYLQIGAKRPHERPHKHEATQLPFQSS